MSGQRWKRSTPKSAMSQYFTFEANQQSATKEDVPKKTGQKSAILAKGREEATLFGVSSASHDVKELKTDSVQKSASELSTLHEADFHFWKHNVTDAAKGSTTDQKLNIDKSVEVDRGVCKSTLLKRSCHLGAACRYKHPARAHDEKTGLDVCLGFTQLSTRNVLDIGDCAVVRIQEAVSLTRLSIWVLNRLPVGSIPGEAPLRFPDQVFPVGLDTLISNMTAFYQNGGPQYLMYPSMADVVDAFLAIRHNFRGKYSWFRGVPLGTEITHSGQNNLKVRLVDLGKELSVGNAQNVRRLHQKFLEEPYFSTVIGLGGIGILPDNVSCETSIKWFRDLVVERTAFLRATDMSDVLEVELHVDTKNGLQDLGALLVEERMALRQSAWNTIGEDYDESDDAQNLMPG